MAPGTGGASSRAARGAEVRCGPSEHAVPCESASHIEVRLAFRGQAPAGTREVRVGGRLPDVRARSAACAVGRGVGVSGSTDEQNTGRRAAGGTGERRWARCCKGWTWTGDGRPDLDSLGLGRGRRREARRRASSVERMLRLVSENLSGRAPGASTAQTGVGRPRNLGQSPASGGSDGAISELENK